MKQQAIIFTAHSPEALKHLVADPKADQPVWKRGYVGFSPSEAAQHVFIPETRRNAYGIKETETEYPGFVNEILSQMDMGDA